MDQALLAELREMRKVVKQKPVPADVVQKCLTRITELRGQYGSETLVDAAFFVSQEDK